MSLGIPFFRHVVFEDPTWDYRDFQFNWIEVEGEFFDSDVTFTDNKLGSIFNNMNPDLGAFRANGGKLIQYHGWSDPDISPLNSINYYESVVNRVGASAGASAGDGLGRTKDFYRLFMAPGVQHCGGGPGPDQFDMVSALEGWVERGVTPERVIATGEENGVVTRSRPLCAYPQEARYTGSGSTDDAANFVCLLPTAP